MIDNICSQALAPDLVSVGENDMVLLAVEQKHVAAVEEFLGSLRKGEKHPWEQKLRDLEEKYQSLLKFIKPSDSISRSDHHLKQDFSELYGVLSQSLYRGNYDLATDLIRYSRIDVNEKQDFDDSTNTHLAEACLNGDIKVAKFLLELGGAKVDKECWPNDSYTDFFPGEDITPLTIAGLMGNLDMARLLVEHGADLKKTDIYDMTRPKELAYFSYLMSAGAEVFDVIFDKEEMKEDLGDGWDKEKLKSIISDLWYDSKLHEAAYDDDIKTLSELVEEKGISKHINAFNPERGSWTALHVASFMNRIEAAKLLLANGADPTLQTSDTNMTALHLALTRGHTDIALLLIKALKAKAETGRFQA